MLTYHFLNARYGLEDLRERRLKISRIMDLNDPFEFLGANLSDRRFRWALKKTKQELSEEHGVLCFSKSWRNPVLWGHYADRHKGLCLGFEIPRAILSKVRYVDSRWPVPGELDLQFMKRLLFTKFSHWQYEQEYRAFVNLDTQIDGHYFIDFGSSLRLKRVIVGDQAAIRRRDVAGAIKGIESGVQVFKARAAYQSFEVVRNRDESTWI